MKTFKIKETDIFLEDYETIGRGKITVSDPWHGAFTYTWGAMGSTISEFIKRIDSGYFAKNLCSNLYEFDPKGSVKNIRKYIREEMRWELPYWEYMELQKEMRVELKRLEGCNTEHEFVDSCAGIPDRIIGFDSTPREEREFKGIISDIFQCEPWNFIEKRPTQEYNWLCSLHIRLKKII